MNATETEVKHAPTGGAAFPRPVSWLQNPFEWFPAQEGMTLRAHIATHALAGYLTANPEHEITPDRAADAAVQYADALIARLYP